MKKNPSLIKKNRWVNLLWVLTVITLSGIPSCKGDKKNGDNAKLESGEKTFKMNCVKLSKAQVQVWVDSGWTKPAYPGRIQNLLLQFYTANATGAAENMQLITYPGKSLTDVYVNGKATLEIDTTCVAKTLSGPIIFGNNELNFDDLKITNPDGSLNDFDFIRFKPSLIYSPYVNFEIEIVRLGVATPIRDGKGTDPCPPLCPPPPPPPVMNN